MSYEAVGEIGRGRGGHLFYPIQRSYRMGPGMGIEIGGQGAGFDPSRIVGFYVLPGAIGLLGLWVVAKIFGSRGT